MSQVIYYFQLLMNITWVIFFEQLCKIIPRFYVYFYTEIIVDRFLVQELELRTEHIVLICVSVSQV